MASIGIPVLQAASLQRVLGTGRTKPCIFFCEHNSPEVAGEYVVKLKAGIDSKENGLAAELIGSQLANYFDLPTPAPALIDTDPMLAEGIPDPILAKRIKDSAGLNFGSKIVTGGFQTWPVDESIPASLKPLAAEIFAFDALIQNPDRLVKRPNVLWKGDDLYIIDHEMAFSFIYDILTQAEPWKITTLKFLEDHLFYRRLKGQNVNFDRFAGVLDTITETSLQSILDEVPEAWGTLHHAKIKNHILEVATQRSKFIDELRRVLYENPI